MYFDHAATSFPKPNAVIEAVHDYATRLGVSPGRGAYREVREAAGIVERCRERLCELINGESPDHVIFTLNCSDALNLAIRGLIRASTRERQHVVTTWMDHNSVLRPLNALADEMGDGFAQTRVEVDRETGIVDPEHIRRAITRDTRLVAVVHASNVTGTLQPIAEIGAICREMAVPLLVDAAQSIGHVPIDVRAMNIDLLAFPGHKGLQGPLGTGALYMRPGMERLIATIREGGTGSRSEDDTQPTDLPDKYEPGSHNALGIAGLLAGVEWVLGRGIDTIHTHERALIETFIDGITDRTTGKTLPGLRLLGPQGVMSRLGVFALTVDGMTPHVVAERLESEFGVLARAGLHCAPLAHRTFGTDPESVGNSDHAGACRLSVGPMMSVQDVKYATDALASVCETATAPI